MNSAYPAASPEPTPRAAVPFLTRPTGWFLLSLLIPVFIYCLLPLVGISSFASLFEFKKLMLLCLAVMGGIGYMFYLRFVLPRPQILVVFMLLLWPIVDFFALQAALLANLNLHERPLLLLGLGVPGIYTLWKNRKLLMTQMPWYKHYLIFFLWLLAYFIFFNANATDTRYVKEESFLEGSLSVMQVVSYLYCLLALAVPAVVMMQFKNFRRLFDTFNIAFIIVSCLSAMPTIIGYPFGMFNMVLDGFLRSYGLFTHPNPFGHHMGILMVYLMGLLFYYQGERKGRVATWLLILGLTVNLIAFFMGLSKTALGALTLCAVVMFLLNLAVPSIRKRVPALVLSLCLLTPIGLLGYQAISGESFLGMLQSRSEQTQSLTWRTQVWQDLIEDFTPLTMITGRGFTSANARVFQLTFNDSKDAQPLMMIHNAYIALLYDLGIMGYFMFVAAFSVIAFAIRGCFNKTQPELRTGYSILLGLGIYFVFACGFDEMSYMFDAPVLFWGLAGVLFGLQWRESQLLKARNDVTGDVSL
jgi:O-antigen ligase